MASRQRFSTPATGSRTKSRPASFHRNGPSHRRRRCGGSENPLHVVQPYKSRNYWPLLTTAVCLPSSWPSHSTTSTECWICGFLCPKSRSSVPGHRRRLLRGPAPTTLHFPFLIKSPYLKRHDPIYWPRKFSAFSANTSSPTFWGFHPSLPRQTTLLYDLQPGILGTPLAAVGCVEEQARGSSHMHVVFWGGLSPDLLQAIADTLNTLEPLELSRLRNELSVRNGLVVKHSDLLAAMLSCNTNVSLLGSVTQSKAILCCH